MLKTVPRTRQRTRIGRRTTAKERSAGKRMLSPPSAS